MISKIRGRSGTPSPFEYGSHSMRWGGTWDNPWFVAQDVGEIVGIKNIRDAIGDLPDDEKSLEDVYTGGGKQSMTVVYEAGLYRLIFKSSKPEAEAFRRWVLHDVLPSIRKTGQYRSKRRERYAELGFSEKWIEQRERGIEVRKDLTETLQQHGIKEGSHFGKLTNAIYIPLLGGTASAVKKARQLPVKANLRDNLSMKEVLQVALSEVIAQERIESENRQGFPLCYIACKEASTSIANATKPERQLGS